MSTLLYVDKMISKKRKANELENEYVSDPFKTQVVSKWLSMCPELKDHQDATIRLCKENNEYTFTIANVGVVHITPDELYAIQDGKRVPLTTRENIEAVRCNGMNAGIVTMWFEIDDDDKKYLRLKRPVDAGQTPLMLKYGLFDDLPEMPCKLFDDDSNLYEFIKHPEGRVLCKEDVERYLVNIRLYCEQRRFAYEQSSRQLFKMHCGVHSNAHGRVMRIDHSKDHLEKSPEDLIQTFAILVTQERLQYIDGEIIWNEMHWYRPTNFINELNKALNRCNDELFHLCTPHIRYVYSEIAKRRPKENLKAIINNKASLLQKLIMILVDDYHCIRGEILSGNTFECPISMLNQKKHCYEYVAGNFDAFIHFILEKAKCHLPLQVYMSIVHKSSLHHNIESMWKPKMPQRGYYGFLNGVFDFRAGVFYPYPDCTFQATDASRVKSWDAKIKSKLVYKFFDVAFTQSDSFTRVSDRLFDVTWKDDLPIDVIFQTQKWPKEDIAFHYAMMGRAVLPTKEDNHDIGVRAVGKSRQGKSVSGNTVANLHPDACVRKLIGKQDKRWGMPYRGANFVLIDEGFKLSNVSNEIMKQRIDGGKQQEAVPNKGMKDIDIDSMSWFNMNDGDDMKHKLFRHIEDRNGALNNRMPSFEYRYEKEEDDTELKSKIEAAVGPLLDRMSQAYKLFKTMKSAWYENLSEKSLVFQSWQGRVDVGASLVDFLSQSTIIAISSEDEYSTLSKYNPKLYKTGPVFKKDIVGDELWNEMHRRCSINTANEKILYRVPLITLKEEYARHLQYQGKSVTDAEKVFGCQDGKSIVISNVQKCKLWNRFKIYIKSCQNGSSGGSIFWAMGVKLR